VNKADFVLFLLLSQDTFNERSGTVIALAITAQPHRANFPLTFELKCEGLPKRSWVKISQIRTLASTRIGKKISEVPPKDLDKIKLLKDSMKLLVIKQGVLYKEQLAAYRINQLYCPPNEAKVSLRETFA
jgi:mRNA interferase MazF